MLVQFGWLVFTTAQQGVMQLKMLVTRDILAHTACR